MARRSVGVERGPRFQDRRRKLSSIATVTSASRSIGVCWLTLIRPRTWTKRSPSIFVSTAWFSARKQEIPFVVAKDLPVFPMCVDTVTTVHTAAALARLRPGAWKEGLMVNFNVGTMIKGISDSWCNGITDIHAINRVAQGTWLCVHRVSAVHNLGGSWSKGSALAMVRPLGRLQTARVDRAFRIEPQRPDGRRATFKTTLI